MGETILGVGNRPGEPFSRCATVWVTSMSAPQKKVHFDFLTFVLKSLLSVVLPREAPISVSDAALEHSSISCKSWYKCLATVQNTCVHIVTRFRLTITGHSGTYPKRVPQTESEEVDIVGELCCGCGLNTIIFHVTFWWRCWVLAIYFGLDANQHCRWIPSCQPLHSLLLNIHATLLLELTTLVSLPAAD
uniref:Uncharacterized protein n=1 Tax=Rhipicephalus microplus TaxID=6941 RepID=A0A6G5AFS8_RHIMP